MIQPLFNWRTGLALIAIAIVSGTIFYSQYLARKIALDERQKVEEWVEATKLLLHDTTGLSDKLVGIIMTENKTVPIIVSDEKGNILDHVNLDSASVENDSGYVQKKLNEFRSQNPTIEWVDLASLANQPWTVCAALAKPYAFTQVDVIPSCSR